MHTYVNIPNTSFHHPFSSLNRSTENTNFAFVTQMLDLITACPTRSFIMGMQYPETSSVKFSLSYGTEPLKGEASKPIQYWYG